MTHRSVQPTIRPPARRSSPDATSHPRGAARQRGAAAVWTLLIAAGAFTLLLGLVVDGGNVVDARLQAKRVAEQAARAGADQLSSASVRSGSDSVDGARARDRARELVTQAGWQATVDIQGDIVRVTVTGITKTQFLAALGVSSFPVKETGAARAITGILDSAPLRPRGGTETSELPGEAGPS